MSAEFTTALLKALRGMVDAHEQTIDDSEGRWPLSDPGCNECTGGCTPNRSNTGPCAYHAAKALLRKYDEALIGIATVMGRIVTSEDK